MCICQCTIPRIEVPQTIQLENITTILFRQITEKGQFSAVRVFISTSVVPRRRGCVRQVCGIRSTAMLTFRRMAFRMFSGSDLSSHSGLALIKICCTLMPCFELIIYVYPRICTNQKFQNAVLTYTSRPPLFLPRQRSRTALLNTFVVELQ